MTNPDYRDLLAAFAARDVRFLIVGGYAVTFHSQPRFTKDLDVWIDPDPANAERVYDALAEFGAPLTDVSVADFTNADTVYQVGLPPNRIDVLTSISGVDFADAWSRRVPSSYGHVAVSYLAKADLIANKRASGRPRDLLDVDLLSDGDTS